MTTCKYNHEKMVLMIDFYKTFKDLLNDLKNTFGDQISDVIENDKNYISLLNYKLPLEENSSTEINFNELDETFLDSLNHIYEYCKNIFPERFFDILYHNEDIFINDTNTEFLPGIHFSKLYFDDTTDSIKETIWKYLQLILFSIITSIDNKTSFGNSAKLFEAINTDEFRNHLESAVNNLGDFFSNKPSKEKGDGEKEEEKEVKEEEKGEKDDGEKEEEKGENGKEATNGLNSMFENLGEVFKNLDMDNLDMNNLDISNLNIPNIDSSQIKNLFESLNAGANKNSGSENVDGSGSTNIPDTDTIFSHINNLINGKIGNLAKELAEETAKDFNLDNDGEDITDLNGVFKKLFKNPGKLMGLVNNISSKLDTKMKDGSIKESELLEEASAIFKNMKSMPGMGNFEEIFKSMDMDNLMPKGGKFNNNAFQHMMDQNIKMSKMKERMKKKVDAKKTDANANATNANAENANAENANAENANVENANVENANVGLNDLTSNLNSLMKEMENNDSFINDILKKQQSQSQANSAKKESKKHGNNKKPNRKKN